MEEKKSLQGQKAPMSRVNKILNHPDYQNWIIANNQAELGREFCRHGLEHAFDTARIAYALWLDMGGNPVAKDIVYSAALLHDVGRWLEYENPELDHAALSAQLAQDVLIDVGYHPAVAGEILTAIQNHRQKQGEGLSLVLYQADKLSRPCFLCPVANKCNWQEKNKELLY